MLSADLPNNEPESIQKLREYNILDTLEETEYNDIASLAAYIPFAKSNYTICKK